MPQIKADRINQGVDYPCPCCRRGRLCPITLTEALGCQQCQKIFVIQPDGYTLEQLSTYTVRQVWHWDGNAWIPIRHRWSGRSIFLASLGVAVVLILVGGVLASRISLKSEMLWWILVAIVVGLIVASVLLSLRSRRY